MPSSSRLGPAPHRQSQRLPASCSTQYSPLEWPVSRRLSLLRNMGSAPLSITSITTTGDFAETDDCTTGVPAAGSCTFSVTFTPTAPGVRSGAVVIQDDAAGSPHKINLSGTGFGQDASLAPTSLTFPSQPIGTTSTAQTVTLTNSGNAPLAISNVQATGDYAQTNNCPGSLNPGSGCTIIITFSPTVAGARNGTLSVTDNARGKSAICESDWGRIGFRPGKFSHERHGKGRIDSRLQPDDLTARRFLCKCGSTYLR